ncbi:MAG: sensor histidine kinase [Gracilibacteraceae bacterium]|jgi:nitrogen-specific signal transduction histidine kinase|nr:sensor histidine kinase [Gracilibacteraceae bacterium]
MNRPRGGGRFALIFFTLLLTSALAFWAVSAPRHMGEARAENGVLDLSGADFASDMYALDGEWEFYHGHLYGPEDFANGEPEGKALIAAPASWDAQGYPLTGFATYRLRILTDEPQLMLHVPEIPDQSAVWIDGVLVFTAGAVSDSAAGAITSVRNAYIPFTVQNGDTELVIQVSNYSWAVAGLYYDLTIGRPDPLLGDAMARRIFLAVFLGMAVAMCIYHLVLFLHRRSERVYFIFAAIALCVAARFSLETNGLVQLLFPLGMNSALTSVYVVLLPLHTGLLALFTHAVFRLPVKGAVRRVVYGITLIVPGALHFLVPFSITGISYAYLCLVPLLWSAVSAARSKQMKQSPYNLLFVTAMGIFVVWGPLTKSFLGDALFMPGVTSNLFLILCQCVMLSVSYAEAREKEQELTAQNAMLGQAARIRADMLGVLSHEVRTPLTVMSAYAQYVAEHLREQEGGLDPQTEQDLAAISGEAKRLSELTTTALRLSQLSRPGAAEPEGEAASPGITVFNIGEATRLIAGLFRPVMERQGRALTLSIPDDLPQVKGNPDDLSRLLWNLLDNALTHAKHGDIEVSGVAAGNDVRIVVKDKGAGIPPELLPHVFERGVSGKDGGSGMGLAICKEIALQHGGEVTVESEYGWGTSASLTMHNAQCTMHN